MFNGRRQPSRDGTSRMTREYQVRFCERLGVKFPGPTRHNLNLPHRDTDDRFTPINRHWLTYRRASQSPPSLGRDLAIAASFTEVRFLDHRRRVFESVSFASKTTG